MEKGAREQKMVRWSIRWKLMAVITLLVFALVAVLSYTQISNQRAILEEELHKRIALLEANLIERGKSFISNLSQQIENDLAAFNISGVMQVLNAYFEVMVEVLLKYHATINEIIGAPGDLWGSPAHAGPGTAGHCLRHRDAERHGEGQRTEPQPGSPGDRDGDRTQ
jgi:hypothetical protein